MSQFEVFYDGECPLCVSEIRMLQRMDRHERILFTDIAPPDFEPPAGLSWDTLMARIHGRKADGTIVEGVEVFRQLYSAVGFSWIVALTRIPGISHVIEQGYRLFAKHRLRLTGRCRDGQCDLPHHSTREAA